MKINAIEGRGTKKDFIDVYFLLQHYSLNQLLDFYAKKYPEHSIFRALRRQYAAYAENVFRYYLEQNQRKDNVGSKKI